MHCPGGNATDPIWRVLASSLGISRWTPLKTQHSNPNITLWPINSGVMTSLILPHLSSTLTDYLLSLNLLCHSKPDARFMQDGRKAIWSIPYVSVAFFPSLKHNFIAYHYSKVSDGIFDIHQRWQSGFSRVYSNCCCICSFEAEIMKIGLSSNKTYSNKILNFQETTAILNAHTKKKKPGKLIVCTSYVLLWCTLEIKRVNNVKKLEDPSVKLPDISWKEKLSIKGFFNDQKCLMQWFTTGTNMIIPLIYLTHVQQLE